MSNRKSNTISIIFMLITILLPTFALAQGGPPDPGGDPGTPIDGGASLLAATAVAYGIKKLKDKQKQRD
jgi:hypothetical protein